MKTTIIYAFTLAAMLLSSSSFSAEYWEYQITVSPGYVLGSTPDDACQRAVDLRPLAASYEIRPSSSSPGNYQCRLLYANGSGMTNFLPVTKRSSSSCPSELPYERPDGFCYAEPEPLPECPDGQFKENGECKAQCVKDAEIKLVLPMSQIQYDTVDPILGCNLTMSQTKKPECNGNTFMCNVYYTDTGVYHEGFKWPNNQEPEPVPEITPTPEPVTTETVDGPVTETVNNPDGSTTTTEITEITKVNGQGDLVEIIGDSIVIKNQSGEIVEILQQYETNTYSDGTSQVTETVTTTATPNSITESKKNLTDGSTTVTTRTYNRGLSGTTTTTTTKTFDSSGKQVGSSTITTGQVSEANGSGQGGEGEGGSCGLPGQPACAVKIDESQADYDPAMERLSDLETEYDEMMDEFLEGINEDEDFGLSDMDWANPDYWIANFLNLPTNTSCGGVISTTVFGYSFTLDPCEKLAPLREILAWFFYVLTVFAVSKIALGRKLV